ncbi:MAG: phenylalanine--tRNA ligase subunit beta [Oscillospiraceae bacterium]|nr:phenylalanine--tRNA ligase subunit beta [Oscillospiraceae bacterium]
MRLSTKWLRDFTDIDAEPREFERAMSLSGSKVEGFEIQRDNIKNVTVGRILSNEKHPNADKLRLCRVDVGDRIMTILTGAANAEVGALTPVAADGAVLPGGKEIRAGMMRGIASEGMCCSASELGLTAHDIPYSDDGGILLLREDCEVGQDINDVLMLDDIVYEFEITSNRPDCLSVRGLAREAAATFEKPLRLPEPEVKGGGGELPLKLSVEAPELCARYSARMVRDIKIGPSPKWMRTRLRAAGVRPINNIVDITNYVMLEYGQPMHAFDYGCLDDGQIVVRTAREGETLLTLDGQERRLDAGMLVIADTEKAVGVAGVMGGANSEITDKTEMIVFESATFSGPSVRKTALRLAMRTDASSRFEKGLDPANTVPALERACELVELLGAGVVYDGIADINNAEPFDREIPLDTDRINRFLGTEIPEPEKYLRLLGFEVSNGTVKVPSFRADVEGIADIAEEAARLYGYNRISSTLPTASVTGRLTERQIMKSKSAALLRSAGYSEMLTYSFISPADIEKIGMSGQEILTIENPLGEDKSVMRPSLIPSLMAALAVNAAARNAGVWLYEINPVFRPSGEVLPDEEQTVIFGGYGMDFFALKGAAEALLKLFNINGARFRAKADNPAFHPGRCAEVYFGDKYLGVLGEIHPLTAERYGVEERVYAAELSFEKLFESRNDEPKYSPLPRFPAVRRDLALICAEDLSNESIMDVIADGLLESAELFDVYTGEQIPDGRKSLAYKLLFRAQDRTLTDAEVDVSVERIVGELRKFGAELRQLTINKGLD